MRPLIAVTAAAMAVLSFASSGQAQSSITPGTFNATMTVGQTIIIKKTITLSAFGANLVDLFFLADNTGSMGSIVSNAKAGAGAILGGVPAGADYHFGVGRYNSDPCEALSPRPTGCAGSGSATTPYYQQDAAFSSSTVTAQNAINTWIASGGGDLPEANFYALQQVANTADWRTGSQRILVWFGDAESHTATTTQAQAIAALQAEGIKVIAFNSGNSATGIDRFGQASAVTTATGGSLINNFSTLSAAQFVAAVNAAISSATSSLDLVFGSTFVGGGLTLSFVCADPAGCTGVGGGASRTFELHITANTPGTYNFEVFASGVDAREFDSITVLGDVSVVPEPSTWVLMGTGLLGLGLVARRRRGEKATA